MRTEHCLVDLGTEELPPKSLKTLATAFYQGIKTQLDSNDLAYDDIKWFASPRRLAVQVLSLTDKQADKVVEKRGPAVNVAFDDQGRFLGLDIQMWNNAGCTLDASQSVMQLAMLHMGNCYRFSNIRIRGRVCKTHLPSNTGFAPPKYSTKKSTFLLYFSISWFRWTTINVSLRNSCRTCGCLS